MKLLLQRCINYCDFIGKDPKLRLGSESRNKTICGGLLCICIFLCIILGLFYFGQELYLKMNPDIVESTLLTGEFDEIVINSSKNSFYFSVKDSEDNVINFTDGYLDVNIYLENTIGGNSLNQNIQNVSVPYANCNNTNFVKSTNPNQNNTDNYYITPGDWYCIQNDGNISLIGNGFSNNFTNFKILVALCTNSTNCKTPTEIEQKLAGAYVAFGFTEYIFDNRKTSNFQDSYFNYDKIYFSPVMSKYRKFELTTLQFFTDTGYIIENFDEEIFYKYKLKNKEDYPKSNLQEDSYEMVINIVQSPKKKNIYRKYFKIQNLLADLGGLAKSLLLMAFVLNYLNDESKYYTKMIDKLFDGDDVFRYFQYHRKNNKKLHGKFRDSVLLTSTKLMESFVSKKSNQRSLTHVNTKTCKELSPNISQLSSNNCINNFLKKVNEEKSEIKESINSEKEVSEISEINHVHNHKSIMKKNNLKVQRENDVEKNINFAVDKKLDKERSFLSESKYFNLNNDNSDILIKKEKLKKNNLHREKFYKLKSKVFYFSAFDFIKYMFCPRPYENSNKKSIFYGGKEMIKNRTDIIQILKKNLEFDRFKNLMLSDNQSLLLDALSKFMLDPERVKSIEYETCSYEKMIDAYMESKSSEEKIDRTLSAWIKSKFPFLEK